MAFLIHHYLEQHARLSPDKEAACCLKESLSYRQLNEKANQLAGLLVESGLQKGDRVAIYMDKCIDMAVAIYGILKAGGAYVPLDPNAPIQRLHGIVENCDISVMISAQGKHKKLMQMAQGWQANMTIIGPDTPIENAQHITWQQVYQRDPSATVSVKVIESDLAYIIYTSGSTGTPKGIMHTHHSCLAYSSWAANEYGLTAQDRLGNHSPLHFDISIFDWFAGIIAGCCTIIIPEEYTKFPASYSELISESRMTVLFTVPFALIQLSLRGALEEREMGCLRWIIFGGEPFPIKHLSALMKQLPRARFDNMYGPAEVNGCTHYTVENLSADAQAIPIGPINQVSEALILDSDDNPIYDDEPGELLVRAPSMMQGYWGREDLNQSAFYFLSPIAPCGDQYRYRYYRTGDLVSRKENGQLWFLGRKDRQVKVRGYRVELDEIEAVLVSCNSVEEAAVYAVRQEGEPLAIYASVTFKEGQEADLKPLHQSMKKALPNYALPAKLLKRESFPRTTSGKIDRTALAQEVNNGTAS